MGKAACTEQAHGHRGVPPCTHGWHPVAGVRLPQSLLSPPRRGGLRDGAGTSLTGLCGHSTQGGRRHPHPPQATAQRGPKTRGHQPQGHQGQLGGPSMMRHPWGQGAALHWHCGSAQIRRMWQGPGAQAAIAPGTAPWVAPGRVPAGDPGVPARLRPLRPQEPPWRGEPGFGGKSRAPHLPHGSLQ